MILGVLTPDSGSISVEGIDIATRRSQALQRTNFAAVYAPLPGNLTVHQNLRVFGRNRPNNTLTFAGAEERSNRGTWTTDWLG
jgi:ABC-type multidrug transport system ATPase subunit